MLVHSRIRWFIVALSAMAVVSVALAASGAGELPTMVKQLQVVFMRML
jgi:hypothetical protein